MRLSDITAIIGLGGDAIAALNSGAELVKGVHQAFARKDPDLTALKKQVSDIYDELLVAKKAQMMQQDALMELQSQAKQAEAFQAEKPRYAMVRTEMGAIVYSLRPEHANGEPPHDLCPDCFADEKKSVLQPVAANTLECRVCGGRFLKPDGRPSGIMSGPVRRPGDGFF